MLVSVEPGNQVAAGQLNLGQLRFLEKGLVGSSLLLCALIIVTADSRLTYVAVCVSYIVVNVGLSAVIGRLVHPRNLQLEHGKNLLMMGFVLAVPVLGEATTPVWTLSILNIVRGGVVYPVRRTAVLEMLGLTVMAGVGPAIGSGDWTAGLLPWAVLGAAGGLLQLLLGRLQAALLEMSAKNDELQIARKRAEAAVSALSSRNEDMRLIMDNAEQGFVTVVPGGTMASERSGVVTRWFGHSRDNETFAEFIRRIDDRFGQMFELGIEGLQEDLMPRELSMDQLPKRLRSGDRVLAFSYVDLNPSGDFRGVLVVVVDITEQIEHERQRAEQAQTMTVFTRLMHDRAGYGRFLRECEANIARIVNGTLGDDRVLLKRAVHTLKGNCGVMGLSVIATACDELEKEMAGAPSSAGREEAAIQNLEQCWGNLSSKTVHFVGENSSRDVVIDRAELDRLVDELRSAGQDTLAQHVRRWEREPVADQLSRIAEQAKTLAQRLGRGDIEVKTDGADLRLEPTSWAPFWSGLVHAVRNAVDHGLYAERDRPVGHGVPTIELIARADANNFVVEVSDNGRGIDWEAVAAKARKLGLPSKTKPELVAALFVDGLSTRDQATSISGRGVGMAALNAAVVELGGNIDVIDRTQGTGTVVQIRFPVSAMSRTAPRVDPSPPRRPIGHAA